MCTLDGRIALEAGRLVPGYKVEENCCMHGPRLAKVSSSASYSTFGLTHREFSAIQRLAQHVWSALSHFEAIN